MINSSKLMFILWFIFFITNFFRFCYILSLLYKKSDG
jgi:hypothetical protein